jgi:hypothetical protein
MKRRIFSLSRTLQGGVCVLAGVLAAACGEPEQADAVDPAMLGGVDGGSTASDDDATPADDTEDDDAPQADDDGSIQVDPVEGCSTPAPGAAPLRRLSNAEYANTLRDLLGDEALVERVVAPLPREPMSLGFRNSADALRVNDLLADQYLDAAFEISMAVPDLPGLVGCRTDEFDHQCAEAFIRDFGRKVYRRPLAEAEVQRYADLYQGAIDQGNDFRTSIEWLAAALFSSANFLFRVELSTPTTGTVARPSGDEMASRLSYLLWQTMPDEELFRAADSGELVTAEGIEAQVLRMVQDEKALRVYEFFEQWLDLDEMEGISRSPDVYPVSESLPELFMAENRAFVYDILTGNGSFQDLLTGQYTFANRTLAAHYGLETVPEGGAFERVEAPGRSGILTQGMLTVHDRTVRTSIVRRGLKIRTDLLCQLVPAPPDTVDLTLPELDGDLSQRERLEQHRTEESCATCHELMDPIGQMFDGFDAVGRPRTVDEAGAAIETSGYVVFAGSLDGEYAGLSDFSEALAESDQVRECFVRQAFRFFYGRDTTSQDACTEKQLMQSFERRDYRIVDLIMGLTQSDQFLYRSEQSAEEAQ